MLIGRNTMVLAGDSVSLREGTPDELEPLTPPPSASARLDAGINQLLERLKLYVMQFMLYLAIQRN